MGVQLKKPIDRLLNFSELLKNDDRNTSISRIAKEVSTDSAKSRGVTPRIPNFCTSWPQLLLHAKIQPKQNKLPEYYTCLADPCGAAFLPNCENRWRAGIKSAGHSG